MDDQTFETLVRRLEAVARRNPQRYKLRVAALALLGYAYIVFSLLLILPLLLHPLLWALGIPLLYLLAHALWVRIEPPQGRPLESGEAPALFREIRKITEALHCPPFHHVLLYDEFNAAVFQQPRLGVFGWDRNSLVIGLPLMMGLSPEQFRAVLAHEVAHLYGAHGRFVGRIYRMRLRWGRFMHSLAERKPRGAVLFRKFFDWYAPYFDAYSHALCRQNEFDADQFAADWVGANHLADELVANSVKDMFLGRDFWRQVWLNADEQPNLVDSPYSQMQAALRGELPAEAVKDYLQYALSLKTGVTDSHPSLTDRLAAQRQVARPPGALDVTAADHFLGAAQSALIVHFDAEWKQSAVVQENWSKRYQQSQENKRRLAELQNKRKQGALHEDEEWELGRLMEELRGEEEAIPHYQTCLEMNSMHASANFAYGRILLGRGNDSGISYLEKVMQKDPASIPDACAMICGFLHGQSRAEEAKKFEEIARQRAELEAKAQEERAVFRYDRACLPHDLNDTEVEQVVHMLAAFPEIAIAYLVRQRMAYLPEQPVYVLGLLWSNLRMFFSERKLVNRIAHAVHAPRGMFWFVPVQNNRTFRNRLEAVPFSKIYSRTLLSRIRNAWNKSRKAV